MYTDERAVMDVWVKMYKAKRTQIDKVLYLLRLLHCPCWPIKGEPPLSTKLSSFVPSTSSKCKWISTYYISAIFVLLPTFIQALVKQNGILIINVRCSNINSICLMHSIRPLAFHVADIQQRVYFPRISSIFIILCPLLF